MLNREFSTTQYILYYRLMKEISNLAYRRVLWFKLNIADKTFSNNDCNENRF